MSTTDVARYGLVGYPLGHSFSRNYFKIKFESDNINARYDNFEISDISMLPELLGQIENLRGLNVTIPYKEAVIPYLTELDDEAASIGAVNVVKVGKNGELKGFNSDLYGFVESLRPMLPTGEALSALVLGVGGASRAVCHGLKTLGINVTRVSRRPDAGELTYSELTPDVIRSHRVIVNTTPLGMYPKVEGAPDIPYSAITPGHICFDLVYNPEITKFMELCAAQGAAVKNGLEMLHLQAERAWEIWNS